MRLPDGTRRYRFLWPWQGVLLLLALLAVGLRWWDLGGESFWFDEGMTAWLTSLSPGRMLEVIKGDVATPLYFLLLRPWVQVVGKSEAGYRAFSALATTLALVPAWIMLRATLRGTVVTLVAAALLAVSFMQVQHAHEARYYGLVTLLVTSALAMLVLHLQRPRAWTLAGFVLFTTAGLYTHNAVGFYLLGLNLAWLIFRRRLRDLVIADGLIVLLYLPWLPTLFRQSRWMSDGTFWADSPGAWEATVAASAVGGVDVYWLPTTLAKWFEVGISAEAVGVVAVGMMAVLLGIALIRNQKKPSQQTLLALTAFALVPPVAMFVYSQLRQPIFLERVLIPSSIVLPILLAAGLSRERAIWVRFATAALLVVLVPMATLSTLSLFVLDQKENWRAAEVYVASLPVSERRLIVFVANEGELPFAYYADRRTERPAEARTGTPQGFFDLDPPKTVRRVREDADLNPLRDQIASGLWDQVVLVESHEYHADPQGRTRALLDVRGRLREERVLRGVNVRVYALY